jgi:hypothetical protein
MSAIKLYNSKSEALYFKDSQINRFYEFGGIQLIPSTSYLQPYDYSYTVIKVESFRLRDDVLLNDLSLYIQATVGYGIDFALDEIMPYDYKNELIYLKFKHTPISITITDAFEARVLSSGGVFESKLRLNAYLLTLVDENDYSYLYSNPFYYTALDEDRTSLIEYRDNFVDNRYRVSLKVWFRQKSRQSELTSYYETYTKNTVTKAIRSHDLDMYESEFMSLEDLIMTTNILESPFLAINGSRCYLFEAVKLPELKQQENFGKIKFIVNK